MNKITLNEIKNIKLMNRIDKKYIINFDQFCSLTKWIIDNYYIVINDKGEFLLDYSSLYWDTIYNNMFYDHENKTSMRQKLRIREYSDGNKYIEIKTKIDNDQTNKIRIPFKKSLNDSKKWIEKNLFYDYYSIGKKLLVNFKRITLVNKEKDSRITIDFGIKFHNYETNIDKSIKDIIIEIKKKTEELTEFEKKLIKEFNINNEHFSKYHTGILLTKEKEMK